MCGKPVSPLLNAVEPETGTLMSLELVDAGKAVYFEHPEPLWVTDGSLRQEAVHQLLELCSSAPRDLIEELKRWALAAAQPHTVHTAPPIRPQDHVATFSQNLTRPPTSPLPDRPSGRYRVTVDDHLR